MDIGSFVVEVEFLSPLFTTGWMGLGGVGYYYGKLLVLTEFVTDKIIQNYAIPAIVPNSGRLDQC